MTLILIKNKSVLAMPNLLRYVGKFIYDEKNMSQEEIRTMQQSFVDWYSAIKFEKEKLFEVNSQEYKRFGKKITLEHKYSEEEYALENMAVMMRENEEGLYDGRKKSFAEKGIDYRKFMGFEEAYTIQGLIDGQKALDESNKREGIITNEQSDGT